MERYRDLKEMLFAELDRIQSKKELNVQILEHADKIAHTLKSLLTIEAMLESGYSGSYPMYYRGYDDRGRDMRYRDGMDRYSADMRRGSYDDGMESYRGK